MNLQELKDIINQYKDKFLINYFQAARLKYNKLLFKKINNKYFNSTSEMIYLVKNYDNLENLHIFCYCGNKNHFKNNIEGYHLYCSYKCMNNSKEHNKKINEIKLNNIDKNGLNSYQRMIIKIKQTKKLKYNDENYNNKNKCNITKLNNIDENGLNSYQRSAIKSIQTAKNNIDKNGLNSYQRRHIKKLNNIDEYGLNSYQRAIIKQKQTKLNNIDENGLNGYQRGAIKTKQKMLNNIDENGLNSIQRSVIKCKQTKLNNIDKNGLNSYQRAKIKRYNTMKENNSFNKSEQEEQVYNYLLQKFSKNDIERQYKSKLYPFASDFYIKSLDLYIECHFGFTHQFKPFKNSIEDLEKLKELKNKSEEINFKGNKKKYYNNVIYTWADLDIRKLNTFKKNKLNYKIFYNIEQFLNWYCKLFI